MFNVCCVDRVCVALAFALEHSSISLIVSRFCVYVFFLFFRTLSIISFFIYRSSLTLYPEHAQRLTTPTTSHLNSAQDNNGGQEGQGQGQQAAASGAVIIQDIPPGVIGISNSGPPPVTGTWGWWELGWHAPSCVACYSSLVENWGIDEGLLLYQCIPPTSFMYISSNFYSLTTFHLQFPRTPTSWVDFLLKRNDPLLFLLLLLFSFLLFQTARPRPHIVISSSTRTRGLLVTHSRTCW